MAGHQLLITCGTYNLKTFKKTKAKRPEISLQNLTILTITVDEPCC